MMDIKEVLLQWFMLFFNKKTSDGVVKSEIMPNQELAEELHKPTIRKFEKGKLHALFKDNIWDADLADMQLISKFNKGSQFYYALLIFTTNLQGLFL